MNASTIAAIASLIVALSGLIAVIRHVKGPQHSGNGAGANDSKNTGGA